MFNKKLLVISGAILILITACVPITGQANDSAAGNEGIPEKNIDQGSPPILATGNVIDPHRLQYQGAFRLPGGGDPPQTFAYGGNAMSYHPGGDSSMPDKFSGSLFVMGHDRIPYGGLPDGNQLAEITIPEPVISSNLEDLNTAEFLQPFSDVTAGYFTEMEEIPKVGMLFLDHTATGPKIHLAWGQHLQPPDVPSHAWIEADLKNPELKGTWFIGNQDLYSVNGYMFEIPEQWAEIETAGKVIGTGRMRDGGQGGMGPTLFAYKPWNEDGSSPQSGARLNETTLLLYENAYNTSEIERAMDGYQHPDEWEGGAWLTTESGASAVIFAGTKATGQKYWYGYIHPDGPEYVCVDSEVSDFTTCRNADGSPCPPSDFDGCCNEETGNCVSMRGWWSNRFDAEILFYNPAQLALVARGELQPWEPQPYAVLDIDEYLYFTPPVWDENMVGWGDQRRYRIGDVAYDRQNGLIYILELFADEAKPVVHVWKID